MEALDFHIARAHFRALLACSSSEPCGTQNIDVSHDEIGFCSNGLNVFRESGDSIKDLLDCSFALVPDVLGGSSIPIFSPDSPENSETLRIDCVCPIGKHCDSVACSTYTNGITSVHNLPCEVPGDVACELLDAMPTETLPSMAPIDSIFIKPADTLMLSLFEAEESLSEKSADMLDTINVGDWMTQRGDSSTPKEPAANSAQPAPTDTAKRKRKAGCAGRSTKRTAKPDESDTDGAERASGRTASMEQHRINEKHRRRGMNESHSALRDVLGLTPSTPVTVVLSTACSCIHELQKQEQEYEREIALLRASIQAQSARNALDGFSY